MTQQRRLSRPVRTPLLPPPSRNLTPLSSPRPLDANNVQNLLLWRCSIPGKEGTDWSGANYPVALEFTEDYPSKPPVARFDRDFFHPNVFPSGKVCLSILNEESGWRPSITIKQILVGIQELLSAPNEADPAQEQAYHVFTTRRASVRLDLSISARPSLHLHPSVHLRRSIYSFSIPPSISLQSRRLSETGAGAGGAVQAGGGWGMRQG